MSEAPVRIVFRATRVYQGLGLVEAGAVRAVDAALAAQLVAQGFAEAAPAPPARRAEPRRSPTEED